MRDETVPDFASETPNTTQVQLKSRTIQIKNIKRISFLYHKRPSTFFQPLQVPPNNTRISPRKKERVYSVNHELNRWRCKSDISQIAKVKKKLGSKRTSSVISSRSQVSSGD
ncbi:hypothetical protein CDAR_84001 [Caerostris darwini]|uniref:Uncharacterized protein n=1 Tax=Caerostris darwini TaxID=1538125 RepID=A0AAV4USD1_9ARAC|nr:hypothetical protein CDAR_84001 [Caerostris darwini]